MKNIDYNNLEKQLNEWKEQALSTLGPHGVISLADDLVKITEQWKECFLEEATKKLNAEVCNSFCDFFNNTDAKSVTLRLKDDENNFENVFSITDISFDGTTVTLIYNDSTEHILSP